MSLAAGDRADNIGEGPRITLRTPLVFAAVGVLTA